MWKDLTDLYPALTEPAKPKRRRHQIASGAVGLHGRPGERLSILAFQLSLRVECVHLRKAAVEEQKDDMLRAGGMVRLFARERTAPTCRECRALQAEPAK